MRASNKFSTPKESVPPVVVTFSVPGYSETENRFQLWTMLLRYNREIGFRNLPDQSTMAAITFSDVVVSHVPVTNGLLFHELVHVEQYRQLGIARFSELYVTGFLNGGGYQRIPLEVHAYELGAQYEANPQQRFSVEYAVGDHIRQGVY
jgi:hypothetical protein